MDIYRGKMNHVLELIFFLYSSWLVQGEKE